MAAATTAKTAWGRRAAELYGAEYARRYRRADDEIRDAALAARFGHWLGELCDGFGREIAVLDLGCGTGRYFRALRHVHDLVGIDVSAAMLAEARQPLDAGHVKAARLTLVEGDVLTYPLDSGRFDLVYSIGVLAEHTPFNAEIAARVCQCLAPGGRFAFTAVHRASFSVPRTMRRRIGEWMLPFTTGRLHDRIRRRLLAGGLYADEAYVREVLQTAGFEVEAIERYESDVHLHCLCVARKARS